MRKLALPVLLGALLVPAFMTHGASGQTTATATPTAGVVPPPPPPPYTYTPPTIAPPPAPGTQATATPSPTVPPTVAPTATPVPLTLRVKLSKHTLNPGQKQKISVTTLAAASLRYTVQFPDDTKKTHRAVASSGGTSSWSYTQAASTITRTSRTGKVTVVAISGVQTKRSVKKYAIGFATVDVSAQPRSVKRGSRAIIWVHTLSRNAIKLVFSFKGQTILALVAKPDNNGWAQFAYTVPKNAKTGTMTLNAFVRYGSKLVSGKAAFKIK